MTSRYPRGFSTGYQLICQNNEVGKVSDYELKSFYNADGFIRVQEYEYRVDLGGTYNHIGFDVDPSELSGLWLLLRVIKPGCFDGDVTQTQPVLSLEGGHRVQVIGGIASIDRNNLPDKYLHNVLGGMKNMEEVSENLRRKYGESLPYLSVEKIDGHRISVRTLKILEPLKVVQFAFIDSD